MTEATLKRPSVSKKGRKQPEWSIISFDKVEEWRDKLGLTKSGMAEALGVTNSTYHNWQRGSSVPYENVQETIKKRIDVLENHHEAGTTPPQTGKAEKPKAEKREVHLNSASSKRVAVGKRNSVPPSGAQDALRDAIGAITVAFIQSQTKAISKDGVYEFVAGLREIV